MYRAFVLCWSVYLKRANLILFDLFSSLSGIKRISSLYFTVLYLEFQSGEIFKWSVYEASWKISLAQKYLWSNFKNLRVSFLAHPVRYSQVGFLEGLVSLKLFYLS